MIGRRRGYWRALPVPIALRDILIVCFRPSDARSHVSRSSHVLHMTERQIDKSNRDLASLCKQQRLILDPMCRFACLDVEQRE